MDNVAALPVVLPPANIPRASGAKNCVANDEFRRALISIAFLEREMTVRSLPAVSRATALQRLRRFMRALQ
jgi:hypothetical protein